MASSITEIDRMCSLKQKHCFIELWGTRMRGSTQLGVGTSSFLEKAFEQYPERGTCQFWSGCSVEQKFQYVPPGSCGDEGGLNGQLARYQLNGNIGNTKTILNRFMNSRKAIPASRGVSRGFEAPTVSHAYITSAPIENLKSSCYFLRLYIPFLH